MVNKVTLIGNLGSDPEVRTLESGAKVDRVSVATNENYRDKSGEWQSQTEWHDVIMWRLLAERAQEYLKKGSQIYVEGKLTHRSWEDQNGNKRRTTEVVANTFRILGRRDGSGSRAGGFPSEEPPRTSAAPPPMGGTPSSTEKATTENTATEADDDLPF